MKRSGAGLPSSTGRASHSTGNAGRPEGEVWLKGATGIPLPVARHGSPFFRIRRGGVATGTLPLVVPVRIAREELPSSEPAVGRSPCSLSSDGLAQRKAKPDLAFVGDVLFAGSVGRSDFPQGDHATLISSIKNKLLPYYVQFK